MEQLSCDHFCSQVVSGDFGVDFDRLEVNVVKRCSGSGGVWAEVLRGPVLLLAVVIRDDSLELSNRGAY